MLKASDFYEWEHKYREAQADLNNREELVDKVISELELDMELLGVTGVEDKL